MKYRSVILLTACVNPNGMANTVLQDASIRKSQYVDALNFYLTNTSLPIVFVENTNTDFSLDFHNWIETGRLEYITFEGNSGFDKTKGKGYGEALMILYAIQHSVMLRNCKHLIKITGRLQVKNINRIANSWILLFSNIWRSNIQETVLTTTVFVSNPKTLQYLLIKHKEEISEVDRGHNWIENVLYRAFLSESNIKDWIVPFCEPPMFDAYSGTSQKKYIIPNATINTLDNLYRCSKYEKLRGFYIRSFVMSFLYYMYLLKFKLRQRVLVLYGFLL